MAAAGCWRKRALPEIVRFPTLTNAPFWPLKLGSSGPHQVLTASSREQTGPKVQKAGCPGDTSLQTSCWTGHRGWNTLGKAGSRINDPPQAQDASVGFCRSLSQAPVVMLELERSSQDSASGTTLHLFMHVTSCPGPECAHLGSHSDQSVGP